MSYGTPPKLSDGFFKRLGVEDEKTIAHLDMAINLYTSSTSSKSEEKARDFERAVGVFSMSYVKMVQDMYRKKIIRLSPEQEFFLNFGALDRRLMPADDITGPLAAETLSDYHPGRYEILYLSEWLDEISRGRIIPTSEAAQAKAKSSEEEELAKNRDKTKDLEKQLDELLRQEETVFGELKEIIARYSPAGGGDTDRLKILRAVRVKAAELEKTVKEQASKVSDLEAADKRNRDLGGGQAAMDSSYALFKEEFDTVVAVIKSCAVRGGLLKSTPALIDKWIAQDARLRINTRSMVEKTLERFEELDPTIFLDKKGNRKAPKIVLLPGVGAGMAWKDRIMISVFPPPTTDPDISFIRTLGGFRWYLTTSSFNWKDIPGEIGSRYQVIYPDKTFNKLEKSFLDDYVAWMTRESLGYQTLNSDVRKLFWKMIPFSKEKKMELAKRATVYNKLYLEELGKEK